MAKIIALANHKGGVGKTTSAVNIAAGLAQQGKSVLLLDLDPQANATQSFGINPFTLERTIYGAIRGKYEIPIIPVSIPDDWGGSLYVSPSCLDLMAADAELLTEYRREFVLSDLLENIRGKYNYIIIDCAPSLGQLTINALTAADTLFIPLQPQFYAVQGLQQLLSVINKIQKHIKPTLTIGGVFLTDYNNRTKMHTDAAKVAEQAFPDEMFKTRIRHNIALAECSARGVSIFQYDVRSNGALDYSALVAEILARFD